MARDATAFMIRYTSGVICAPMRRPNSTGSSFPR